MPWGQRSSAPDPLAGADAGAIGLILIILLTETAIGILLLAINPQYPKDRLQAVWATSIALSLYGAAKLLGQPVGGWLADRIHPRTVLFAGLVASIPVIVVMERIQSSWVYLAMWVVFGTSLAGVWPAVYAIIGQRYREDLRGRLLSLVSAGQLVGTVSGIGIGAVLIDHVSYLAAFGLAIGVQLLALAITVGVVQGAPRASMPAHEFSIVRRPSALRSLAHSDIILLIGVIMVLSAAVALLTPDLKPYSKNALHLEYSQFVLLLVPPGLLAAALIYPAGWLADRAGRTRPVALGLSIFAGALFALSYANGALFATAWACIAAVGFVLATPALSASLLDVSTSENRGLVTGVSTSIQSIGLVIASPIGGGLIHGFGSRAPFRAAAFSVVMALALALAYSAQRRSVRRDALPSAEASPLA